MASKVIVTVGRFNGADLDRYVSITAKGGTTMARPDVDLTASATLG